MYPPPWPISRPHTRRDGSATAAPGGSSATMRLLMASTESPPPVTNGFRLRLYGLLSALRTEHDIHLVCYGESVDIDGVQATVVPPPPAWGLGRRVVEGAVGWVLREPAAARSSRLGGLGAALTRVAARNDFDAVHVANSAIAFAADCVGTLPR